LTGATVSGTLTETDPEYSSLNDSGVAGEEKFIGPELNLDEGATIFASNSSRTESLTIAPHAKQMDSVGARLRLQTGQFISSGEPDLEKFISREFDSGESRRMVSDFTLTGQ
jgi:hypothetical protein